MKKSILTATVLVMAGATMAANKPDPLALNFHLMHPGGDSKPGDPNAAGQHVGPV